MGTLMCIGLTTANSILVVTFANQRMDGGRRCVHRGRHGWATPVCDRC